MPDTISATVVAGPGERAKMLTAEQVAGIPAIGEACDELEESGLACQHRWEPDHRQRRSVRPIHRGDCRRPWRHRRQVGDLQDRRHASGIDCWSGA